LTEESQVDLVMSNLFYLQFLNGLPIEREDAIPIDDGRSPENDSFGSDDDEISPPRAQYGD